MVRFLRWLFFCLCFLFFPLLVVNLGVRHAFDQNWEAYTQEQAARVGQIMESGLRTGVAVRFYYEWLRSLSDRAASTSRPLALLCADAARLDRRFPGLFDFYITDGEGNAVYPKVIPTITSRYLIKKLYEAFALIQMGRRGEVKEGMTTRILAYFWSDRPPNQHLATMHQNREVSQILPSGRRTWLFAQATERFGLFVHINRAAVPPWFPVRVQIAHLNRLNRTLIGGVALVGETPQAVGLSRGEERLVQMAVARLEVSPRNWLVAGNRLITALNLDSSFRLWSLLRLDPEVRGELWTQRLALLTIGMFLLISGAAFGLMVLGWELAISIRYKLVGLFGIATGLPLVVLLSSGFDYLQKTEEGMLKETREELQESLKSFDAKFPKIMREYQTVMAKLLRDAYREDGAFDFDRFARNLKKRQGRLRFASPSLIKRDGTVVEMRDPDSDKKKTDRMIRTLGLETLRKYNQNHGFGADTLKAGQKLSAEGLLLEGEDMQGLLNGFMERVGEVSRLQFAQSDRFIFFDLVLGPKGIGEAVAFILWAPEHLYKAYIRRNLLARQRDVAGSRLYALHATKRNSDLPDGLKRPGWLTKFLERVQTRNSLVIGTVQIHGVPHLVAGLPGKEVPEFVFVQTKPLDGIELAIDRLRRNLFLFGILSFALSIGVGASLARQFLTPIATLSAGVQLMKEGKFRSRIQVLDQDELGLLSSAFNSTMESLEQLSVAKTLQERLFPGKPLHLPGAQIFGQSVTASELGGDYFDYFALDTDKAVILIGDVAGHGVASALLMAMAKAVITMESKRDPRPAAAMTAVNRMIFESFQKRMMMTFFYALLDAGTGTLTFANAGHNHPFWFPAGQDPVELKSSGFPLGTRKNPTFQEQVITLSPGDHVWFYTDGIVETPGPAGQPLGYEGMTGLFRSARGSTVTDRLRQVFRECDTFRRGLPQPDDMTLILLARAQNPGEGEPHAT